MENASKALLMAAGILVGVLILTLLVTLLASSRDFSKQYDEIKSSEAIQQFNVNFIKYVGQELTMHQVVTICNFADQNNVSVEGKRLSVGNIVGHENNTKKYRLTISEYSSKGYITKIKIQQI